MRWLFLAVLFAGTAWMTPIEAQQSRAGQRNLEFPPAYYNSNLSPTVSENSGTVSQRTQFNHVLTADMGTSYSASRANDLLYSSGSVFNIAGPPAKSVLQSSLGMTTYGANANIVADYSIADDFTLTDDSTISSFEFYSYQTGATSMTINAVYVQVWDGIPGAGGTVIWGNLTSNIISGAATNGGYRVLETTQNDTSRIVQVVTANTTGLSLDAGTYYVQVAFGGTNASGPWAPPVTITGNATTGNAMQYTGSVWQPWLDGGSNTALGLPFKVFGEANNAPITYCTPAGTNSSYYINSFSTTGGSANISNMNSGFSTGGYGDFYDTHTVSQVPGGTINFEAGFPTGQTYGVRIWVDWNQDGVFSETEEVAWQSTGYGNPHTGSFNVPATALPGATRMRVVGHWLNNSGNISPCSTNHSYGEFEDYKILVGTLDTCTGTPDGGTASVSPTNGNAGSAYTVSASGFEQASGLSFQWESKTTGDWESQGTASTTYSPYTATAAGEIGDTTQWRLKVTCTASGQSSYSTVATFTVSLVYCTSSASTTEPITRVIVADIDNSSPRTGGAGYQDFTSITGHMEAGESYTIKCEGNTAGNYTNHFVAWVDWNQNGTFDADERTEIGSIINSTGNDGQQAIGAIAVPTDALSGQTRMRIIKNFNTAPTTACGSYSFGQTEDYTIEVSQSGTNNPPVACEQEFFNADQTTGVGFSGGNKVANDITVAADGSFTIESIEFDVVVLGGTPSQFTLEIFNDNGSGGIGAATGTTFTSSSSTLSYVPNGTFAGYPQFRVTLNLPDIELTADASGDARYWLSLASELSTTGDYTYWVSYNYTANSQSYASWQFSSTTNSWAVYTDAGGLLKEGLMKVQGLCSDDGGGTTDPTDDCSFGDITTTSFDNAYNIEASSNYHIAAGFLIEEGVTFTMNRITVDVNQQEVPNNAILRIRENNNGTPGSVIETITMAPTSSNAYGSAFGDPVYHLTFDLAAPIAFTSGTYWLDAKMSTPSGEVVWWLASEDGSNPIIAHQSGDNGTSWVPDPAELYMIFSVSGECEDDGGTTDPGDDCSLSAASNNFENGASVTKAGGRIVAQDVVVAAGKDMLIENLEVSLLIGGVGAGINAQNVDVIVYENNNGMPGNVVTTLSDIVPSSQVTNGDAFNYQAWKVDIPVNIELEGQDGEATTYWIGISVLSTDASNVFWEFSTAAVVGLPQAYYNGTVWESQAGREGVYVFEATCSDHDGTTDPGDDCSFGDITTTSFDNAYNIEESNAFHAAAGFAVQQDVTFTMNTITVDVNQQEVPDNAILRIREDNNGTPGSVIETITMAPTTSNAYGSAFGDPVYHLTFDLAAPVVLTAGTYWLDAKMSTPSGETVWWLASSIGSNPIPAHRSTDGGVTWAPDSNGLYLIFSVSGSCDTAIGIEDNAVTGFSFYPNPVETTLFVKSDVKIENVSGYNVLGQLVINNKHFNNGQIDVSALPTGAYVFRVKFENGLEETFRVLKKQAKSVLIYKLPQKWGSLFFMVCRAWQLTWQ